MSAQEMLKQRLADAIGQAEETGFLGCPPPLPRPQDSYFTGMRGFLQDCERKLLGEKP